MAFQPRCQNRASTHKFVDNLDQSTDEFQKSSRIKTNYKAQASNFLKKSLSSIISNEMKAHNLKVKLDKQMLEYKKNIQKKQMIEDMHKVEKFRNQQSQLLRSRFQDFSKKKQRKQSVIEQLQKKKSQKILERKIENKKKLQQVRQRHEQQQQLQINLRLSRIQTPSNNKQNSLNVSRMSSITRKISSSKNHREVIRSRLNSSQQSKVTNYIQKMKVADSRILQKQLKKEERIQKSIRTQVKNLTQQKISNQQNLMKTREQRFNVKMGKFVNNFQKQKMNNTFTLKNRSFLRSQFRQKVNQKKQQNDNEIGNKTIQNFMRGSQGKQNFKHDYQNRLDLLRSKSSYMNNTIKHQKQNVQKMNEKNMRVLYAKIQKMKNMSGSQVISKQEKQQLLSLIDSGDPNYSEIVDFLSQPRSEFLKKKIQKQQERIKIEKAKKSSRFNKN